MPNAKQAPPPKRIIPKYYHCNYGHFFPVNIKGWKRAWEKYGGKGLKQDNAMSEYVILEHFPL